MTNIIFRLSAWWCLLCRHSLLFLSLTVFLINPLTVTKAYAGNPSEPVAHNRIITVQEKDVIIRKLRRDALLGSTVSALKLLDYYLNQNKNITEQIYWRRIAAQNGSAESSIIYAHFLQSYASQFGENYDSFNDNIRAFFWAKKAFLISQDNYITAAAKNVLFDKNQIRANYWSDVEFFYRSDLYVVEEAKTLKEGLPVFEGSLRSQNFLDYRLSGSANDVGCNLSKISAPTEVVKINALLGDGQSALFLARSTMLEDSDQNSDYWLVIGAEDGQICSEYMLAKMLGSKYSDDSRIRAIFWAEKVQRQGSDTRLGGLASALLSSLEAASRGNSNKQ